MYMRLAEVCCYSDLDLRGLKVIMAICYLYMYTYIQTTNWFWSVSIDHVHSHMGIEVWYCDDYYRIYSNSSRGYY